MGLKIGKKMATTALIVFFLAVLALLTFFGVSDSNPELIFLLYLAGIACFLFSASVGVLKNSNDRILFWGSFIAKIAYALYRFPISNIANPTLSTDAGGFWKTASQYYAGNFSRQYTPYPYILNFEFHIFGKNVLCCILTNIVISMIMVLLVVMVLNRFEVYGNSRFWAVLLASFLIYGIIVSDSILREAFYIGLIAASFYQFIEYVRTGKHIRMYLSVFLMLPVLALHIGYFPIVVVYIIDFLVQEKVRTRSDFLKRFIMIAVFVAFAVYASQLNSVGYLTEGKGIEGVIQIIAGSNSEEAMGEAGSRYLAGLKINSVSTFLLYTPVKWFFYLFSPLPTNWRDLTDAFAFFLDGCVHLAFLFISGSCVRTLKRKNKDGEYDGLVRICRVGIWSVVLCALVFGLDTSTAGTAIRHRDVLIGVEAILIGIGLHFRAAARH